jgi:CRISPR-associated protein Csd2
MNDINKVTGLLVIEAINSNPNGDPDSDSDPRQRYDGRGEISPVSFKRKLRDLVEDKKGPVWLHLKQKLGLKDENFMILESRGRDRSKIKKEIKEGKFVDKYWDARIFGNTFLEGQMDKESIKTGVVQLGMGVSVAPVNIERHTNTNKAGVQEGKNQGMAPLAYRVVTHGLYAMPFFINPSNAHKSGCTAKDIELFKELIPYAYSHNRSAIRPFVEIRQAWFCDHGNQLGSYSDFDILNAFMPKKKGDPEAPSKSIEDYELVREVPEDLESKVKCTDLISEYNK